MYQLYWSRSKDIVHGDDPCTKSFVMHSYHGKATISIGATLSIIRVKLHREDGFAIIDTMLRTITEDS